MAFAVIETGGKQYKVSTGTKIKVEKLDVERDGEVIFDKVLLLSGGNEVQIGAPYVSGARVIGKVLEQGRDKKIIVFRYHSKTRYRKKKGHRQLFTKVEITKI
jgi:large subunit ribosomal protein L21